MNNSGRDFYYQSKKGNLETSFKKTLGMHLFKMRQGRRFTNQKVCEDLNIKVETLDKVEIGKGYISWSVLNMLLKYYRVRVHMSLEKNHFCDKTKPNE